VTEIVLIYQPYVPATQVAADRVASYLGERGERSLLCSAHDLSDDPPSGIRLSICFGGDGTALRAARWLSAVRVPVLPVRMGKLSFLGEISPDLLPDALEPYLAGDFWLDQRAMLQVSCAEERWLALNDAVLARGASPRAVSIEVQVDDVRLVTYLADGVIVSTATGSTAYSLAAGGPVVAPELRTMIVTPIVPHLTSLHSVVLPETARVKLINRGYTTEVLTADGQVDVPIAPGGAVVVAIAEQTSLFARRGERAAFYRDLAEKLTRT
jgi:NAD+ kinase